MNIINKMQARLNDIVNQDVDYSQIDFDKEFGHGTITPNPDYTLNGLAKIKLNFVNKSNNPNPEYATNGSSGFDLRAFVNEPVTIYPNKREVIPTGLYFDIPNGYEIQVRSRSGLSAKNGVAVLNSPGTIDSDYTGEIKVILINHGDIPFIVNNGDRIAQAIFASVLAKNIVNLNQINEIGKETDRNSGGFGSTGVR